MKKGTPTSFVEFLKKQHWMIQISQPIPAYINRRALTEFNSSSTTYLENDFEAGAPFQYQDATSTPILSTPRTHRKTVLLRKGWRVWSSFPFSPWSPGPRNLILRRRKKNTDEQRKHCGAKKRRHSRLLRLFEEEGRDGEMATEVEGPPAQELLSGPFDEILSVPLFAQAAEGQTSDRGRFPRPHVRYLGKSTTLVPRGVYHLPEKTAAFTADSTRDSSSWYTLLRHAFRQRRSKDSSNM